LPFFIRGALNRDLPFNPAVGTSTRYLLLYGTAIKLETKSGSWHVSSTPKAGQLSQGRISPTSSNPRAQSGRERDFWERANWIPQSSLYLRHWTPTPAAEAYHDLVFNQWWTRWQEKADRDGYCRIPAFLGRHRMIVDGSEKTAYLEKAAGEETISLT
jgi:hypothetical protein